MKIFSEKTNKEYKTVEECIKAEKEFDEKVAAEKAAKEKALAEKKAKEEKALATRKTDAEKVDAAYKVALEANKAAAEANRAYHNELAKFCDKWGAYHRTYKVDGNLNDLLDNFFNSFWF